MNIDLILFRHGKAETRNPSLEDQKRALSEEGKEELRKFIPELRALIKSNREIHLWSSPMSRAVQTAEIIAEGLDLSEILQFEFIANGDLMDLEAELAILERPITIIVVGHEPHLGDWSKKICGYQIPFKKGSAALLSLNSICPLAGRLEGFLQPKFTMPDKKKSLKKEYQKILIYYLQETMKIQNMLLITPEDPETVHQFRVKIRQFRSLISFIKPLLNPEEYMMIQDQLRGLAAKTAYLREIDVLKEEWGFIVEKHSNDLTDINEFLISLEKERKGQKTELYDAFTKEPSSSALFSLWIWLLGDSWDNSPETDICYGDYLNRRFEKWLKKAQKELKEIDLSDPKATHKLRIRFKKLRYILTILAPPTNNKSERLLSDLKVLQDNLGKICDTQRDMVILEELKLKYRKSSFQFESGVMTGYLMTRSEQIAKEIEKANLNK